MTKRKRKLTPADKAHKKLMHEKYEWIFLNGKQKKIRRVPGIENVPGDPVWLLQNETYEELHKWEMNRDGLAGRSSDATPQDRDDNLPF